MPSTSAPLSVSRALMLLALSERYPETEVHFESYGVRFTVQVSDPAILTSLVHHFPPGWTRSDSSRVDFTYSIRVKQTDSISEFVLSRNASVLVRSPRLEGVIDRFALDVHHRVAEGTDQFLFVHAGVVGWQGRAIVLPGATHTGKSRLVEALVAAGALYYSDEFAVLDQAGLVYPYPKPIAHRTLPGVPRVWRSPEDLGGAVGKESLPVCLVAALRFSFRIGWNTRKLSQGQTVLTLLDNTVLARTRTEVALHTFARMTTAAVGIIGTRDEAGVAGVRLLKLLAE